MQKNLKNFKLRINACSLTPHLMVGLVDVRMLQDEIKELDPMFIEDL